MAPIPDLLASSVDSPFTIHNIPFGVISSDTQATPRCATAIGEYAIDLVAFAAEDRLGHVLGPGAETIFSQPCLNTFAALGRATRRAVRDVLIQSIRANHVPSRCLIPLANVTMHLPFRIGGFSDFYCSLEHVQNCSPMAAGAAIPDNWFYAPSVYNSRVSSVVPSPQPIRRPRGVYYDGDGNPAYGPSREVDYELEMGVFVSQPVKHGEELAIEHVEEHIFGFVLLNDWSSRDLQIFEMKPLGPFHSKGSSCPPPGLLLQGKFVDLTKPPVRFRDLNLPMVTLEALEPFRCPPKTTQSPAPFDHLKWPGSNGTFDIHLEIDLIRSGKTHHMASSNLRYLYWTPFQQLAHHASAACGLGSGDLIGTGTISGDKGSTVGPLQHVDSGGKKTELGCLYEATQAGSKDVELADGTRMQYLQDGDEIVLKGSCGQRDGNRPYIGFGECRGILLPARKQKVG
ncbi:LOW QUALITY PROTEIN: Fumarylacetoacetate hydrolase [Colletotrichum higginsianum IMI 349063]|uniref:Fumarylacetoacetase n=1 Tax=Colletotrichum higginsianum (strain IMI 349063) TaxID=759273 RepID=A0A1B7Y7W9_COLHI|nr:LOW QUALITY PROTEIN: Fumarylacetoacetate hydrolase [Colletotrichum higginsianum IMI 349063]OBR08122.1 LOW QUALITY PROTEIN: Fumarylacetoacetate hydrolase [Colletotrichum higginsianum IMI 349063]